MGDDFETGQAAPSFLAAPRNPAITPSERAPAAYPSPRPLTLFLLVATVTSRVNRPVPLYAYAPVILPCRLCGEGFEQREPAGSRALAACPTCGQSVRRAAAHAVNSPQLSAPLSVSRAKQAGFTVLKRTAGGEFEKK